MTTMTMMAAHSLVGRGLLNASRYVGMKRSALVLGAAATATTVAVVSANKKEENSFLNFFVPQWTVSTSSTTAYCDAAAAVSQNSDALDKDTTLKPNQEEEEEEELLASSMAVVSEKESLLSYLSSSELTLPALEAAVRAARLGWTVMGMIADYKLGDFDLLSTSTTTESDDPRVQALENELDSCREALEQAQLHYSRSSHEHIPSLTERVKAKRLEKQAMMDAAHRLAQAEEDLALFLASQVTDDTTQNSSNNNTPTTRRSRQHQRAANRLLDLCRRNGGVYIKIGQHLANLDYLLPDEYIATLSSLFDDTPQTSYENVAAVIAEELGAPPDALFDGFERQPMASASLAQVHVAYDKATGRKLAVKVQHRGLRETSRGDLYALVSVVHWAERVFADSFTYGWLADEIAPHLPKELDFVNEGRNAERAAHALQTYHQELDCVVPKIDWSHTTARVLTMEFEEGTKATNVEAIRAMGLQPRQVAHLISSVFASQIFGDSGGWVHCDPHPGNLLVRPNLKTGRPQLVLLDHGLYRELDRDFCFHYAQLWKSLFLADLSGIQKACFQLGVDQAYPLFAAVLTARPFDELIERSKQPSLSLPTTKTQPSSTTTGGPDASSHRADHAIMRGYAQNYMGQIFDLLGSLPRQMLLLLKLNDCLRHVDALLLGSPTNANTLLVSGRYASHAVCQHTWQSTTASLWEKCHAWWSWIQVLWRIQLHNVAVWWIQQQHRPSWRQWLEPCSTAAVA